MGHLLARRRDALRQLPGRLGAAGNRAVEGRGRAVSELAAALEALSPLKVLARGYSIAYGERGVVTSVGDVRQGDRLRVRMSDGTVDALVEGVDAHAPA